MNGDLAEGTWERPSGARLGCLEREWNRQIRALSPRGRREVQGLRHGPCGRQEQIALEVWRSLHMGWGKLPYFCCMNK